MKGIQTVFSAVADAKFFLMSCTLSNCCYLVMMWRREAHREHGSGRENWLFVNLMGGVDLANG